MNWDQVREQFLVEPGVAYLNTGSYGLVPRPVFEAVTEFRRRLTAQPTDFLWRHLPDLLWTARTRLADFLGGVPERLAFTVNVTAAINTVANGLHLQPGSEVLMTDHEYPAMRYAWEHCAKQRGWEVRTLELPVLPEEPAEIVERVAASITGKTRVLFFSHVLYTTGMVLPARELAALAREHGILCPIDGAHAPGMIPLNVNEIDCDYYCGNCHKWLLVPMGTGFLHFGRDRADTLDPLVVSWGYHNDAEDRLARDGWGSTAATRFLEFQGTRDPSAWISVPATLEFREEVAGGEEAIRGRIAEVRGYLRREMAKLGWSARTPAEPSLCGGVTSFAIPEQAPERLSPLLWEHFRIEAPTVDRPDGNLLRISTHFYNSPDEIGRLTAALSQLAK
jgi:isopenicillin-N epimerase